MTATLVGRLDWKRKDDKESHREYRVEWLVETSSVSDGPQVVAECAGLPGVGSSWAYGNDNDVWAKCWPTLDVNPVVRTEPGNFWKVGMIFSTKPLWRCQTASIENPLNEPLALSGSYVAALKKATKDRHGELLKSSSWEMMIGPDVEFDEGRPTVIVGMNLAAHPLSTYSPMMNHVNDATLWGIPKRTIKLSNATWSRKLWGLCTYYYTVTYEFDINFDTFDREVPDRGTKKLLFGFDPNVVAPGQPLAWKDRPEAFFQIQDVDGNPKGYSYLNGLGQEALDPADIYLHDVEYYHESNFLLLGVPATL